MSTTNVVNILLILLNIFAFLCAKGKEKIMKTERFLPSRRSVLLISLLKNILVVRFVFVFDAGCLN